MLRAFEIIEQPTKAATKTLELVFDQRQKSRLKTVLTDGTQIGLFLDRGIVLRDGDCLKAEDDTIIKIVAAPEAVSTILNKDMLRIAKAAYHLGNRHVQVQIGEGWLRYSQDHVLDEMVSGFGLSVSHEHHAFEPEAGAYGGHENGHNPQHKQSHGHEHNHQHHQKHSHSHDDEKV